MEVGEIHESEREYESAVDALQQAAEYLAVSVAVFRLPWDCIGPFLILEMFCKFGIVFTVSVGFSPPVLADRLVVDVVFVFDAVVLWYPEGPLPVSDWCVAIVVVLSDGCEPLPFASSTPPPLAERFVVVVFGVAVLLPHPL